MLARVKRLVRDPNSVGRVLFSKTKQNMNVYHSVAEFLHPRTRVRHRYFNPTDASTLHRDGFALFAPGQFPGADELVRYARQFLSTLDILAWKARSKKPFLMSQELPKGTFEAFTHSSKLVDLISGYFGRLPVVGTARLWYSPNELYETGRSQDFHLDGIDATQIKAFLFVDDIDENTGPFTAVGARDTKRLLQRVKVPENAKVNFKVQDREILPIFESLGIRPVPFVGPAGTLALVDTCRAMHFGSRPTPSGSPKPRVLVATQYLRPYAPCFPLFGRIDEADSAGDERARCLTGDIR